MKLICDLTGRRVAPSARLLSAFMLALCLLQTCAPAPAQDAKPDQAKSDTDTYETIHLSNAREQNDLTEISTALRNMLPHARIYANPSQRAISIRASAADMQLAHTMVADLDRARKAYRLTYTLTDIDGGKRGSTQSFSLVVSSGERGTLKQGSRVPILTGSYDTASSTANTQFQYQDLGLSIQATPNAYADGLRLSSKVEQTSVSDQKSAVSPQDPVVNQTVLDSASNLALDKPQVLGSVEVPGTTHRQEVAVLAELVK